MMRFSKEIPYDQIQKFLIDNPSRLYDVFVACCTQKNNLPIVQQLLNEYDCASYFNDNSILITSLITETYNTSSFLLDKYSFNTSDEMLIKALVQTDSFSQDIFNRLIMLGIDIHVDDEYVLRCCAYYGNYAGIQLCLEHGSNIHADNDYVLRTICGYEPYVYTMCGCEPIDDNDNFCKYLIKQGANIHANNDQSLVRCIKRKSVPMVKLLLEMGVDVRSNDQAFIQAISVYSIEIIDLLIQYGADINILNTYQPPITVNQNRQLDIIKYLLDHGVEISQIYLVLEGADLLRGIQLHST
jgi:hypothetical protein